MNCFIKKALTCATAILGVAFSTQAEKLTVNVSNFSFDCEKSLSVGDTMKTFRRNGEEFIETAMATVPGDLKNRPRNVVFSLDYYDDKPSETAYRKQEEIFIGYLKNGKLYYDITRPRAYFTPGEDMIYFFPFFTSFVDYGVYGNDIRLENHSTEPSVENLTYFVGESRPVTHIFKIPIYITCDKEEPIYSDDAWVDDEKNFIIDWVNSDDTKGYEELAVTYLNNSTSTTKLHVDFLFEKFEFTIHGEYTPNYNNCLYIQSAISTIGCSDLGTGNYLYSYYRDENGVLQMQDSLRIFYLALWQPMYLYGDSDPSDGVKDGFVEGEDVVLKFVKDGKEYIVSDGLKFTGNHDTINYSFNAEPVFKMSVRGASNNVIENGANSISLDNGTDFGLLRQKESHRFEMVNNGCSSLAIKSISIGDTENFKLSTHDISEIPSGGIRAFNIEYDPLKNGDASTVVNIETNLGDYSFTVGGQLDTSRYVFDLGIIVSVSDFECENIDYSAGDKMRAYYRDAAGNFVLSDEIELNQKFVRFALKYDSNPNDNIKDGFYDNEPIRLTFVHDNREYEVFAEGPVMYEYNCKSSYNICFSVYEDKNSVVEIWGNGTLIENNSTQCAIENNTDFGTTDQPVSHVFEFGSSAESCFGTQIRKIEISDTINFSIDTIDGESVYGGLIYEAYDLMIPFTITYKGLNSATATVSIYVTDFIAYTFQVCGNAPERKSFRMNIPSNIEHATFVADNNTTLVRQGDSFIFEIRADEGFAIRSISATDASGRIWKIGILENGKFEIKNIDADLSFNILIENTAITPDFILENQSDYVVYPNPATDYILVAPNDFKTFTLLNTSGQVVLQTESNPIWLNQIASGSYVAIIEMNDGRFVERHIVVK